MVKSLTLAAAITAFAAGPAFAFGCNYGKTAERYTPAATASLKSEPAVKMHSSNALKVTLATTAKPEKKIPTPML